MIALLAPFILGLFAVVIYRIESHVDVDLSAFTRNVEFPEFNFVMFFMYNLMFFGFGEEIGWRGFALPHLQNKHNALVSSILLTLFWAFWHWPLFLYRPGYVDMEMSGIVGWVLSLFTGSILLTWLYNSSRGSILVCAVFHTTIDVVFTADISDKQVMNYLGMLITIWGVLTLIIFKSKNLSKKDKVEWK